MIRFKNVTKRFLNGQEALRNINFHVDDGEMVFLTGHSGAGKSTILNIVAMLEEHSYGDVQVAGESITKLPKRKIPALRRKMGYVGQNPELLLDNTVFNNIALPLRVTGCEEREIPRRVRAALDKVGLLNKEKMTAAALSSGEQQRVGIARAIVNRPNLILADEPTGNLDHELAVEIMQLFQSFNQFGTSVFLATHDIGLIKDLPYRHLKLIQGRLLDGSDS